MKKIAIFVEGQTELLFTCKLIEELCASKNFQVHPVEEHTKYFSLQKVTSGKSVDYFFLVYNSSGDGGVKSRIRSNHESLKNSGYELILGLRDLFPSQHADISKVQESLYIGIEECELETKMSLAVMEIEAWFMQQSHFNNLDQNLSAERIQEVVGFNPLIDDPRELVQPSSVLSKIYEIVGLQYSKKKSQVQALLTYLEFEEIYLDYRFKIPELDEYIKNIEYSLE